MAKVLRSKYNSTGERCVDACLSYGELRYVNEDGSPITIEIPSDKYQEAISDFEDRVKEGITQNEIDPKQILKRGSLTYTQAKSIANEGKIRGLDFFEIDGSIECDHVLGISGSIEYALSLWNGESREEALLKSIIRAIKVYGEEFIRGLNLDNTVDIKSYIKFAKNVSNVDYLMDIELYKLKNYAIDSDTNIIELNSKKNIIKDMDLSIGIIGAGLALILVQGLTNNGAMIDNNITFAILNMIVMMVAALVFVKGSKFISDKYIKTDTRLIVDMFNEELEKVSYDNLLAEKEICLILKNITKGEVSRLLLDMKGSVNKKISSNTIVTKETKFILEARRTIILPSEHEINEGLANLVHKYHDKLSNEYNVNNI